MLTSGRNLLYYPRPDNQTMLKEIQSHRSPGWHHIILNDNCNKQHSTDIFYFVVLFYKRDIYCTSVCPGRAISPL